jgi:hypothetical protein
LGHKRFLFASWKVKKKNKKKYSSKKKIKSKITKY